MVLSPACFRSSVLSSSAIGRIKAIETSALINGKSLELKVFLFLVLGSSPVIIYTMITKNLQDC